MEVGSKAEAATAVAIKAQKDAQMRWLLSINSLIQTFATLSPTYNCIGHPFCSSFWGKNGAVELAAVGPGIPVWVAQDKLVAVTLSKPGLERLPSARNAGTPR